MVEPRSRKAGVSVRLAPTREPLGSMRPVGAAMSPPRRNCDSALDFNSRGAPAENYFLKVWLPFWVAGCIRPRRRARGSTTAIKSHTSRMRRSLSRRRGAQERVPGLQHRQMSQIGDQDMDMQEKGVPPAAQTRHQPDSHSATPCEAGAPERPRPAHISYSEQQCSTGSALPTARLIMLDRRVGLRLIQCRPEPPPGADLLHPVPSLSARLSRS